MFRVRIAASCGYNSFEGFCPLNSTRIHLEIHLSGRGIPVYFRSNFLGIILSLVMLTHVLFGYAP